MCKRWMCLVEMPSVLQEFACRPLTRHSVISMPLGETFLPEMETMNLQPSGKVLPVFYCKIRINLESACNVFKKELV